MAVAFDAVGPSASGASSLASASLSWTHTPVGIPTAVVVGVALGATSSDAGAVLSATYGGSAMTALAGPEHANSSTAGYVQLFGLASPPSGAQTVAVTSTGGNVPTSLAGGSVSYTGTGGTTGTAFGTTAVAAGSATPGSVSLTGTGSSNRVFGAVCDGSGGEAATAGTLRYKNDASVTSAAGNAAGSDVVSAAGTVTVSWSFSSDWWGAAAVEVLAGSGGGGGGSNAVGSWPARPGRSRLQHHHGARRQQPYQVFVSPDASPVAGTASATGTASGTLVGPTYIAGITGASGGNPGYFVDNTGKPKLVWGEAVWGLCGNVGRWTSGAWQSDYDTYTSTRAGQGFTAVYGAPMVTVHNNGIDNGGSTFDSLYPFQGGTPSTGVTGANPSTGLTSAYWSRIDYFLNSAKAQGITVFMNAVGYDTDFDGGPGPLAGKSSTEFQAYGAALGTRYASQPNLVWTIADDYFGAVDSLLSAFLTGLRGAGDTHPITIENFPESTSRLTVDGLGTHCTWGFSNAQYNFVYSYNAIYYGVELAYTADGTVPVIAGDGYFYQGGSTYSGGSGSFAFDRAFRQDAWHALSSGARGKIHGSESTWQWASTAASAASTDWFYVHNAKNIRTVIEGLAGWQNLIPDTASALVTAGRGTHASAFASGGSGGQYEVAFTDSYVTASKTPDGTLALVYLSHGTTITVNTALLATGWTATWIDPVTGATSSAGTGTSYNSTAKGSNSQGDPDWVLAFQSASANATASAGLAAATGAAFNPQVQINDTAHPAAALAAGAAFQPVAQPADSAPVAAASGTAFTPAAQVTALPAAALATGAASAPFTSYTPAAALATAVASAPFISYTPAAALATGAALSPGAAVTALPAAALATGAALNPSVTTSGNATANAGLAAATGAAFTPAAQVTALPAAAPGTGAAFTPVAQVTALPAAALATGAAFNPSVTTTGNANASAGLAAASGAALNPVAQVTALPAAALATAVASAPFTSYTPAAALAAGAAFSPAAQVTAAPAAALATGAAFSPSVSTTGNGTAFPAAALAAGAAFSPAAAAVTALPAAALAAGAAFGPAAQVTIQPGAAAGTGTAFGPSVTTTGNANAQPGVAAATGAAQQPLAAVTALPAAAPAAGAALGPAAAVTALPAAALATGTAFSPSVSTTANATAQPGVAAGAGAAQQPLAAVTVFAGFAAAAGAALKPGAGRAPAAALATGLALTPALALIANAQAAAAALAAALAPATQSAATVVKGNSTASVSKPAVAASAVGEAAGTSGAVTSPGSSSGGVS